VSVAGIIGFLQLGSAIDDDEFVPVAAYPRATIVLRPGEQTSVPAIHPDPAAEPPVVGGLMLTHAAVFDSQLDGTLLLWFPLVGPFSETPWPYPVSAPRLDCAARITHAMNATMFGGRSEIIIEDGEGFATVDGQPVTAGCRLVICNGSLVPAGRTVPVPPPALQSTSIAGRQSPKATRRHPVTIG
jgi:hypothetical protein